MKKTNPSKVIIIPQTPQNNNKMEEQAPQANAPVEAPAPQGPAQQQAKAEIAEEEAE